MDVWSSNLQSALSSAIRERQKMEALSGYTSNSTLLQGWVDTLEALKRGEQINIKRD